MEVQEEQEHLLVVINPQDTEESMDFTALKNVLKPRQ
jgi:hypothetical protein